MTLNTFLYIAIMLFAGLGFGRLAKRCKLPNVTGYLIAGLLLGPAIPSVIPGCTFGGIIPADVVSQFDLISNAALGFIAFSIGNEFKIAYFKRVGATPIVIACFESLLAVVFVVLALVVTGHDLAFSLVLGSIAAATAPAATIMVINQYKSKGAVTETLLSVVAIDDATALIMFGLSVAAAQAVKSGSFSIMSLLDPVWEIFGALIVGFLLGLLFIIPLRWFKKDGNRLAIIIGFVFACVGIANVLGLSALLLCMALGATVANLSSQVEHISKLTDSFTPPIYMLFFVTSGAGLQLSALPAVGVIGAIYIVFRVVGKVSGAAVGAAICKADVRIRKYLGFALLPQAGAAIGLSLVAQTVVPEYGDQIRAIILCGTLIYELIGPAVTKLALTKAGEIKTDKPQSVPAAK